jgi:hypothetical protein
VGGYRGEVRGKSKADTYLRYLEECERWDLSRYPDPKCKKSCKKQMVWDDTQKEWVLKFRFSR